MENMKQNPNIQNIGELFADLCYYMDTILDDYADKQGKPTKTIDEFLNDKQ